MPSKCFASWASPNWTRPPRRRDKNRSCIDQPQNPPPCLLGVTGHNVKHALTREKALEGKYVIQTEEQNLSALEVVARYKELNEVERGFAHLKGLLELRPIYHHSDERVQAHVFVAALALLLDRALEKQLRAAGSPLSSPFAWQALETIRCVELDLGSRRKLCVTRGNQNAQQVLRILGITQLDPPTPEKGQESLMY